MRHLLLLSLVLMAPAAALSQGSAAPLHVSPPPRAEAPIVAEARQFMVRYGDDLMQARRGEIAARYDRRGAWRVGPAKVVFEPWAQIDARYRRGWLAPSSFEWQDLAYEPVGADAVSVVGRFVWGPGPDGRKPPVLYSYSALLVRQDGQLRIRVEHESAAADPPAKARGR